MRTFRSSWVSTLLAAGCFGDPPVQDTDASTTQSADTTAADATAGPGSGSGDGPTPSTTADATADTTVAPTSDTEPPGTTTGSTSCGDGVLEIGELCFSDDAAWVRQFEGDIVDLAVASVTGDPGDGGVLVLEPGGTTFYWWAWDGVSKAGPTVSFPQALSGAPGFVLAGDIDQEGNDELIVASADQVYRWRWDGIALVFDGPCASPGTQGAIGQVDEDPALELLWVPAESSAGILPWLALETDGWCIGSPIAGALRAKPSDLAIGPFLGGEPDDVAMIAGPSVVVAQVTSPFQLGKSAQVDFDGTGVALHAADLDGDGARDELVLATTSDIAGISFAGGPTISDPTPAGTVADIAIADLDSDGDDDVVVVDISAPSPLFLLSSGVGTFEVVPAPFEPGPSSAVATGDLDGDLAIDLVLGGVDGTLRAYLAQP